jgi:uncharacterized membrane protein
MHRDVNPAVLRFGTMFALTGATAYAVAVDWSSPIRTAVTLGFLLFVPGLALMAVLGVKDLLHRWAFATGVSLALETTIGLGLLYAGGFSVDRALAIIVVVTIAALGVAVMRERRPGA